MRTPADDGVGHGSEAALHLLQQILHLERRAQASTSTRARAADCMHAAKNVRTKMVRSCVLCGSSPGTPAPTGASCERAARSRESETWLPSGCFGSALHRHRRSSHTALLQGGSHPSLPPARGTTRNEALAVGASLDRAHLAPGRGAGRPEGNDSPSLDYMLTDRQIPGDQTRDNSVTPHRSPSIDRRAAVLGAWLGVP